MRQFVCGCQTLVTCGGELVALAIFVLIAVVWIAAMIYQRKRG